MVAKSGVKTHSDEWKSESVRTTVTRYRWLSAVLILGASIYEAWLERTYVMILVGLLVAAAYWAILPWLVRFSVRLLGGRRGRPV
jgi:hypothetical protein